MNLFASDKDPMVILHKDHLGCDRRDVLLPGCRVHLYTEIPCGMTQKHMNHSLSGRLERNDYLGSFDIMRSGLSYDTRLTFGESN